MASISHVCLVPVSGMSLKSLSKTAGLMQNPIINISFRRNSDADDGGEGRLVAILRNRSTARTRYSRDLTVNVQGQRSAIPGVLAQQEKKRHFPLIHFKD